MTLLLAPRRLEASLGQAIVGNIVLILLKARIIMGIPEYREVRKLTILKQKGKCILMLWGLTAPVGFVQTMPAHFS